MKTRFNKEFIIKSTCFKVFWRFLSFMPLVAKSFIAI